MVDRIRVHKSTRYQDVLIADNLYLGTFLVLDGKMQSSNFDERMKYECLVHPALVCNGSPRRVLLIGSAEGCAVREILRLPTVQKVSVHFMDGETFLGRAIEPYDVIILDTTEWNELNPISNRLFTDQAIE